MSAEAPPRSIPSPGRAFAAIQKRLIYEVFLQLLLNAFCFEVFGKQVAT
jgi:hypothetical protein